MFSDSFCQFFSQQKGASTDGSHYATINPRLSRKNFRKNLFTAGNTYEKNIVCNGYCIAHHDDKTCFLPASIYNIILIGEIEEFLHKLDTLCFTYQHMDCLYTLFRYRFSGKIFAKKGNVSDNVQRAVSCNQRNRGVDKTPNVAKKRLLGRKIKQHFMSALRKKQINADQWFSVCRKNWKSLID